MAYQTIATKWLLSKCNTLDVSFGEHKWNVEAIGPITDIEVRIKLGNTLIEGRGTDADGNIALEKASSEAIERWCCRQLKVSSVGCAIHSNPELAETHSKNEFIERFIFEQLKEKTLAPEPMISAKIQYMQEKLAQQYANTKLTFWELAKTQGRSVILSLISDEIKPIALGLSLESENNGLEKALIEALRNFVSYKTNVDAFFAVTKDNPDFWCCNPDYLEQINSLLKKASSHSKPEVLTPVTQTLNHKVSDILSFSDCHLFFSRTKKMGEAL